MNKDKKNNDQKFKLGRNSGTLLLIFGGLILLFLLISIPYSYITEGNKNDITPFKTKFKDDETALKDVKRMKASDFKVLDVDFYCKEYNVDADKTVFSLNLLWNDYTSSYCDNVDKFSIISSTNTVETYIGLCADWVSFEKYSSSTKYKVARDAETQAKTITITTAGIKDFPKYANTWPIKVKVETPSVYVYISFSYVYQGKTIPHRYILEYSYNDYYVSGKTQGGI